MYNSIEEKKKLSKEELEIFNAEFENRKVSDLKIWLFWACGFFGIYGLHTIPLKEKKKGLFYLISTILIWLLTVGFLIAIISFNITNPESVENIDPLMNNSIYYILAYVVFITIMSFSIVIVWIVDAIKLQNKLLLHNQKIEREILDSLNKK